MRKTITKTLALAVSLLCLLALAACPPDTSPTEDTETVVVTNIPKKVNGNDTYKVYVQLSEGMSAAAGYVAKGEALISQAQTTGDTYTVTITELKDPAGTPWKGSNNKSVNIIIRPSKVDSIDDIMSKGNLKSSSKTLNLNWDNLILVTGEGSGFGAIGAADYNKLYEDIVVADGLDLGN
jgi:hypothetical protein